MSDLESTIWQRFAQDGVLVYGVYNNESAQLIADFIEQTGVTYPVVADPNFSLGAFAFPPGVGFPYPRDVVIGKDLTVRSIKSSFDVGELADLVDRLVAEP